MRHLILLATLGAALSAGPLLVGCDRTVSDQKTSETKPDGTTVNQEVKKTVDPNTGNVTQTKTTDVDKNRTANP